MDAADNRGLSGAKSHADPNANGSDARVGILAWRTMLRFDNYRTRLKGVWEKRGIFLCEETQMSRFQEHTLPVDLGLPVSGMETPAY